MKINFETVHAIVKITQENRLANDCPYFKDCCDACCVDDLCNLTHFNCSMLSEDGDDR